MKKEKGIILIALIITIIVILILVGVTINFALNGGLINKAKEAGQLTQKAADKETLELAVLATIDNSGEFQLDDLELPTGFTYNSANGTYVGPTGNEYIINSSTGKVTDYNGSSSNQSSDSSDSDSSQSLDSSDVYNISFIDMDSSSLDSDDAAFISNGMHVAIFYPATYNNALEAANDQNGSMIATLNSDAGPTIVYSPTGNINDNTTCYYFTKDLFGYWVYTAQSETKNVPPSLQDVKIATQEELDSVGEAYDTTFAAIPNDLLNKIITITPVGN